MRAPPFFSHTDTSAGMACDAVAERCDLAISYAAAAANLAAARDTVGMMRALGAAARTILAATEAAETIRPRTAGGGR